MKLPLWLTRQSLRLRLILASELVLLATMAAFAMFGLRLIDESVLGQLKARVEQIEPLLLASATPALAAGDEDMLQQIVVQATAGAGFTYLVVFDAQGKVIAARGWDEHQPLPPDDTLDRLPPDSSFDNRIRIIANGSEIGAIQYGIPLDFLRLTRNKLLAEAGLIGTFGVACSLALLLWLTWAMTRELARVNAASRQMAEGNFSARIETTASGEIAQLTYSLNSLAATVEARLRELRANEERLGLILQGSSDGIWDRDLTSNRHYYSPRFRELLGYGDEREFRNAFSFETALHPDDRARVLGTETEHLAGRGPFDQIFRLRLRDGNWRWFRGRGQAMWDAAGQAYRFAGSLTDIHDGKAAEESLRESEERLLHAMRSSTDGIWDWDLLNERYYIAPQLKALTGYDDAELENERASFFALMHPGDRGRVKAEIARHFAERVPFDTELRLRHKDGSLLWFRARGQAVWDDQGRVVRFSGACMDIMAQKRAQAEISELLAQKQVLIDNMLVGVAVVRDGTFASCNRHMETMLGYEPGELKGKPPHIVYANTDECAALHRDCMASENPAGTVSRELNLLHKQGNRVFALVRGCAIDMLRPHEGSVWLYIDDSERRRTLDALHAENAYIATLLRGLPDIFYLADRAGRLLRWNDNLERITGLSAEDLGSIRASSLFDPAEQKKFRDTARELFKVGTARTTFGVVGRDGRILPSLMSGACLEIEGVTHVLIIGQFLTPEAFIEASATNVPVTSAARETTPAETRLAIANQALESFLYSVSHDLTAPLRGIDGFARMLDNECSASMNDVGKSYLQRIRAAAERMQSQIEDLLQIFRITSHPLSRREVDLGAMASSVLATLSAAEPSRKASLTVEPDLLVDADPALLRTAIEHLVGNAWKFTSRRPHAQIDIGRLHSGDKPVYFVRDNGVGFEMQYAGKLFTAFHRLHRISEFAGSGIGLATVSRIVQRHGGQVWAQAEKDHGATFYFTLG